MSFYTINYTRNEKKENDLKRIEMTIKNYSYIFF